MVCRYLCLVRHLITCYYWRKVINMRLGDYLQSWVSLRSAALRPRTLDSYHSLIRLHIAPSIGARKLRRLRPDHVQGMLLGIVNAGHTRTAELCYVLLRAALADALRLGRIDQNPMDAVQRPRHIQQRPSAWGPEDIRRYLSAIRFHKHRIAFRLALFLGLRRGELCGLRWSDIDLRARVVHVCNQRIRLDDGRIIDQPPKTSAGIRDLPIPSLLLRDLRSAHQIVGYVVPLTPSGLDTAHRALVRRLGLPYIPLHGLRHTMATAAVRSGASMRALADVLGHADPSITAKVYTHPDMAMRRSVIDTVSSSMVY